MACNCKNKVNNYVDVSNIEKSEWEDVDGILGLDECGNMLVSEKPDTLSAEDRERLNNAVTYDENNDVRLRKDLYLGNDNNVFGVDTEGAAFNLIEMSRWDVVDFGSSGHHFNINSQDRPTVQLPGETGSEAHQIAFLSDIPEGGDYVVNGLNEKEVTIQTDNKDITISTGMDGESNMYLECASNGDVYVKKNNVSSPIVLNGLNTRDVLVNLLQFYTFSVMDASRITLDANSGDINLIAHTGNINLNNGDTTNTKAYYNGNEIATVNNIPDTSLFIANGLNNSDVNITTILSLILSSLSDMSLTSARQINISATDAAQGGVNINTGSNKFLYNNNEVATVNDIKSPTSFYNGDLSETGNTITFTFGTVTATLTKISSTEIRVELSSSTNITVDINYMFSGDSSIITDRQSNVALTSTNTEITTITTGVYKIAQFWIDLNSQSYYIVGRANDDYTNSRVNITSFQ